MAHDERQTSDDDAIYDAVYRDFDRELSDLGEGSWSETIGLLSGRSVDGDGYRVTRAAKLKRLREVLRIAARYDILHGLTPQTLRSLLEELGPTFVKAGQILSMRSEILPQSFCDELTKLRTDVEPMDRDTLTEHRMSPRVCPSAACQCPFTHTCWVCTAGRAGPWGHS